MHSGESISILFCIGISILVNGCSSCTQACTKGDTATESGCAVSLAIASIVWGGFQFLVGDAY